MKLKNKNKHSTGILIHNITVNNGICTLLSETGKVLGWTSYGRTKYKGHKRRTDDATHSVASHIGQQAARHQIKFLILIIRGYNYSRVSSFVKTLKQQGCNITRIFDGTLKAFNGTRLRRLRRV